MIVVVETMGSSGRGGGTWGRSFLTFRLPHPHNLHGFFRLWEKLMLKFRDLLLATLVGVVCLPGCGGGATTGKPSNQPPLVIVKRVPCKVKLGPVAASIEVDLSELKNLVLDAKQLMNAIIFGESSATPPDKGLPVIMIVNKKNNKFTFFQLNPNVKEVRLKNKEASEVELVVRNQEPLQIELWVNSENDVEVDVEFKEPVSSGM